MAWWPEEPLPNLETVTETATQSSTMDLGLTTLSTTSTTSTTTTTFTTPSPETIRDLFSTFERNFFQNFFNQTTMGTRDTSGDSPTTLGPDIPNSTVELFGEGVSATVHRRIAVSFYLFNFNVEFVFQ